MWWSVNYFATLCQTGEPREKQVAYKIILHKANT